MTLNQAGCNMHSVHCLKVVNICCKLFQNGSSRSNCYEVDTICENQTDRKKDRQITLAKTICFLYIYGYIMTCQTALKGKQVFPNTISTKLHNVNTHYTSVGKSTAESWDNIFIEKHFTFQVVYKSKMCFKCVPYHITLYHMTSVGWQSVGLGWRLALLCLLWVWHCRKYTSEIFLFFLSEIKTFNKQITGI